MTHVRRLALNISNAVVRYASPGSKEWAEGLAREVAFIPSDWAALVWALGSVRVLFHYREELASLDDLSAASEKFAKLKRNASMGWTLPFLFEIYFYSDKFFHATNALERIGCRIVVFGFIALLIFQLIEWCKRPSVPPSEDVNAVLQFYLEELRRSVHGKFWIFISAATVLWVGLVLSQRGGPRVHPVWDALLSLVWIGMMLLLLSQWRISRKRLERLKALLTERS